MIVPININLVSVLLFSGALFGIVISLFFIFKPSLNKESNLFQGLLLLSFSLIMVEQVLTITGMITRMLWLMYSTAFINYLIGPFLFLYVKRSLGLEGSLKEFVHFILPFLYFIYLIFSLIQPEEFKYNMYVRNFASGLQLIEVPESVSNDPLRINRYLNILTVSLGIFYIILSMRLITQKAEVPFTGIFSLKKPPYQSLRNVIFHILGIILVFIIAKAIFSGNAGDYLISSYISFFILITAFNVINDSSYFDRSGSFLDIPLPKYKKSSLAEEDKDRILASINRHFSDGRYYLNNLASLSELARRTGVSQHNVSQVINERLKMNFYEMLAKYRIEEAKKIFLEDKSGKLTIEEVSEKVGYNSKTSFNNAFRKLTGKTPSEFRKSLIV